MDNTYMEGRKKDMKENYMKGKKIQKRKVWQGEESVSLKVNIARNYNDFMALFSTGEMKIHSSQAIKVEKALSVIYFHWSQSLSSPKVFLEVILEVVSTNLNQSWHMVNKT